MSLIANPLWINQSVLPAWNAKVGARRVHKGPVGDVKGYQPVEITMCPLTPAVLAYAMSPGHGLV